MEAYQLVERTCALAGCGKTFKVLSTSSQHHHSDECKNKDPNYVAPPIIKKKLDVSQIVKRIDEGAPLVVEGVTKANYREKINEQKQKDKALYIAKDDPKAKWEKAVEEAKAIVGHMRESRLKIAELAISVCDIQIGGNWRAFARIYTMKNFAHDIGVHPKTLHQWIRIKKNIHDQLPEGEWVDDWGLAVRVDHKIGSKPAKSKVAEAYNKEKNRNKPMRRFQTVQRSLDNFVHLSGKKDVLRKIPKEDLKAALETVNILKRTITARLQELV